VRFSEQVVIVTGAGTGLGAAYAAAFAAEGATVVVADIRADAAGRVANDLRDSGATSIAIATDVSNEASVQDMVAKVLSELGRVDILVNNAAVMFRFLDQPRRSFWETTLEDWELVQRVNVTGSWLCAKAVFEPMRAQGRGKIVNVSSNMALGTDLAWPAKMAPYTTSKAAIIGLTRVLAGEAGPHGITVNAIAPGVTNTETIGEHVGVDAMAGMAQTQAIKREAWPDDMVGTVLFLSSCDSDFMTGQVLCVDGGLVSH
jgi:NAD(P)-dependent dehydrogenase (short-subunit alcohol dehydrogenase family)